ncbi:Angiotensin-converting enzyme 2 [Handroanthus impetiginosus]|uniref:Angiotensin-converting enzyme 2 n=1 Tax=Handroanthus impetiginosus TaxID=429701 RepID=A0A2G9G6A2_9LAMI|nr:Angiotensin-converting enzyme 2 [Handroanthus impetiginosus]
MSGGEGRKLSNQDIQVVQNRIEQCLRHYMNKKEVINALIVQDNIEPHFTELVWQRLELENQEFFKAYYLKLLVKDQIMEFNRLLSEQVELMRRIGLSGIAPVLTSNGSHVSPTQHISTSGAAQNARPLKTEDIMQANVFHNCGSSIQSCVQGTLDGPVHGRKIDVPSSLFLSQNSNIGLGQAMNGKIVKTEAGFAGSSPFDFSPNNYLESRPLMGDASVSSFSSVESNTQHINDPILDGDASSFGFLTQIPQNFSLPELPADFTSSSDLLESYCRPPFLPTDTNNFVDPQGDVERLDPESESLRFQCFGGD